jgi:hypothetical protein
MALKSIIHLPLNQIIASALPAIIIPKAKWAHFLSLSLLAGDVGGNYPHCCGIIPNHSPALTYENPSALNKRIR